MAERRRTRSGNAAARQPAEAVTEQVRIRSLGARGDGVADGGTGPVYVAQALPGETVTIAREGSRGRVLSVDDASPDRIEPFCPYFARCGGCVAQHMAPPVYTAWKRGILEEALAQAGIEAPLAPLVDAHGLGRRRITLHARQRGRELAVGYMMARSHDLVAIDHCPIAEPGLEPSPLAALAIARAVAGAGKPLDLQITATESGLDIDIRGLGTPSERDRQALIAAAGACDLARLSVHGEVLIERRAPVLTMGRARVSPPAGGFLQATRAGEEALAALVLEACDGAKRVADLFAGCGPFALRIAERAEVHAVETETGALAALDRALRGTPALRRITTEARDLFRRPLLGPELARFDAVVMDPPRAGAEAQARQLAAASVPVVVSVSCDAGTFARDAAVLIQGGYRLERVMPVDQFKYTPHLEIVGIFRKDAPRRRR